VPDLTPKDPLSDAQRAALQKAYDLLTEHFEAAIIVCDWECDDPDEKRTSAHECWWHGGSIAAIGLAAYAKDRILRSGTRYYGPGDPEEDETD
jgi:hypothetical protein